MNLLPVTWYLQAISDDGTIIYNDKLTDTEASKLHLTLQQIRNVFDGVDGVEITEPMRTILKDCLSSQLLSPEALGRICGIDAELLKMTASGAKVEFELDQAEFLMRVLYAIKRNDT